MVSCHYSPTSAYAMGLDMFHLEPTHLWKWHNAHVDSWRLERQQNTLLHRLHLIVRLGYNSNPSRRIRCHEDGWPRLDRLVVECILGLPYR